MSSNKGINVIIGLSSKNIEKDPFSLAVVRGMIRSIYGNDMFIQVDEIIRNCSRDERLANASEIKFKSSRIICVNSSISPPQSLQSIETGSVSQIPIFLDTYDAVQAYGIFPTEDEELILNGIFADVSQQITALAAQKQLFSLLLNQQLIDWQGLLKKQSTIGEKMCSFLSKKLNLLFEEDVKNGKINANELTLAGIDAKTSAFAIFSFRRKQLFALICFILIVHYEPQIIFDFIQLL
ncbi:MAG: hypothetical protein EZS28_025224 [Streblomastix strix]|uniref:Uncharacterized protein n=1 Tax=Streblomastix strix TaxID=222440 RepID=A0A5J4V9M7_9EUKA|nr:MAG: hypothetical protein EZS28_025224 [Streblomastix strix]